MGLRLLTDDKGTVIYRKDKVSRSGNPYTTYFTKTSSKDSDGNWQSAFVNVRFKKGVEVNNKSKISIKDSFPTLDSYNGNTNMSWMIMDFDVLDVGEVTVPQGIDADGFMNIPDGIADELPFK